MTENNLCGYGDGGEDVLADTVHGPCGSLSLRLSDGGDGFLKWRGTITSTAGPILNAGYYGNAHNHYTGGYVAVNRTRQNILHTVWDDRVTIYTAPGVIYGEITHAWALLIWGGHLLQPGYRKRLGYRLRLTRREGQRHTKTGRCKASGNPKASAGIAGACLVGLGDYPSPYVITECPQSVDDCLPGHGRIVRRLDDVRVKQVQDPRIGATVCVKVDHMPSVVD